MKSIFDILIEAKITLNSQQSSYSGKKYNLNFEDKINM